MRGRMVARWSADNLGSGTLEVSLRCQAMRLQVEGLPRLGGKSPATARRSGQGGCGLSTGRIGGQLDSWSVPDRSHVAVTQTLGCPKHWRAVFHELNRGLQSRSLATFRDRTR